MNHPSARAREAITPPRQPESAGLAGQAEAPRPDIQVLEFLAGGQRFAVPLSCVRRAVLSAMPVPLPGASEIVLGVLDVGGQMVTVLDFGRRAGCGATTITPQHQFIIAELGGFLCALVVDRINGPGTAPRPDTGWPDAAQAADFVDGALRLPDGLCLVVDPARFLFEHEKAQLGQALAGAPVENE